MKVSVNVIKQGEHKLIAACDLNLLGKTLQFGEIKFEIKQAFYGGSVLSLEEAADLMRNGTCVNMIGPAIVKKAIEEGLIHPKAILDISGIPHAQIVRM